MVTFAFMMATLLCTSMNVLAEDSDTTSAGTSIQINSVVADGLETPVAGKSCVAPELTLTTDPENAATIHEAKWRNNSYKYLDETDTFKEGEKYHLVVTLFPNEGYMFSPSSTLGYMGTATITGAYTYRHEEVIDGVLALVMEAQNVVAIAAEDNDSDTDKTEIAVTLDQQTLTLEEGASQTLVAAVTSTDQKVTWESSDPSVAIVADGVVTAVKAGKATITAASGDAKASCEVTVTEKAAEPAEELVPIYRLYLKSTGEHLYTSDYHEYRTLYTQYNWGYEGVAWYAPTEGTEVYRLYQPGLQNHLYTTDKNEVRVLTSKYGWVADNNGEALYYSGGDVSIYRVYNKGLSGMHHLTTDANEYNTLPKYGWSQEGVKLNALKLGSPLPTTKYYGQ